MYLCKSANDLLRGTFSFVSMLEVKRDFKSLFEQVIPFSPGALKVTQCKICCISTAFLNYPSESNIPRGNYKQYFKNSHLRVYYLKTEQLFQKVYIPTLSNKVRQQVLTAHS